MDQGGDSQRNCRWRGEYQEVLARRFAATYDAADEPRALQDSGRPKRWPDSRMLLGFGRPDRQAAFAVNVQIAVLEPLRQAVRELLLPIAPDREDAAVAAMDAELTVLGIGPENRVAWLRLESQKWDEDGVSTAPFQRVVRAGLREGDLEFGQGLANRYFALHKALEGPKHGLSRRQATLFLSHAGIAAQLTRNRLTAAQIANILAASDARVRFHWSAIQALLQTLHLAPELNLQAVQSLTEADRTQEEDVFADADDETTAEMIGQRANMLGFPSDLGGALPALTPKAGATHGPYLQILHFQCVIAEFFDHPLSILYEFAPRGAVANWVFGRYPAVMGAAGNPVLNNAKAIDRLSEEWAQTRSEPMRQQAYALTSIILGMEAMGFAPRRDLAAWIRLWLERQIRLSLGMGWALPDAPTKPQIDAVLAAVAQGNTATAGIVEQRLLDALSFDRHPEGEGWRVRGLGDSVNASNVSRHKLGDCDFQHPTTRRVVAYEVHAGLLNDLYVQEHIRTLKRVIALRRIEWEGIADAAEWTVEIVFVAHALGGLALPEGAIVEGTPVSFTYRTFGDFIQDSLPAAALIPRFTQLVHGALNRAITPQRVRDTYAQVAGIAHP